MWRKYDWPAIVATLVLIIVIRESCVWLMAQIHHPELGNLLGMILLLIALLIWRRMRPLPMRLLDANAHILKESAFAFLPVSAGSAIMLLHLGHELPWFMFVMVFSTLFPLWLYARIAKRWI